MKKRFSHSSKLPSYDGYEKPVSKSQRERKEGSQTGYKGASYDADLKEQVVFEAKPKHNGKAAARGRLLLPVSFPIFEINFRILKENDSEAL